MITLKTLEQASEQEVFDQVAEHLLKQGEKSVIERYYTYDCMYRHGDLRCAAGCLIGDDEYKPEFEGHSWSYIVDNCFTTKRHYELISKLQSIHDSESIFLWIESLEKLAKERLLSTEVLEKFK